MNRRWVGTAALRARAGLRDRRVREGQPRLVENVKDLNRGVWQLDGTTVHNVGNLQMHVTNWGAIGSYPSSTFRRPTRPPRSGRRTRGSSTSTSPVSGSARRRTASRLSRPRRTRSVPARGARSHQPGVPLVRGGARRGPVSEPARRRQDGLIDEDWLNGFDDDGDGRIDEDFAADRQADVLVAGSPTTSLPPCQRNPEHTR